MKHLKEKRMQLGNSGKIGFFSRKRNILYALIFLVTVFAASCSKDNNEDPKTSTFNLTVSGLPQLDDFHVYEGWLIVGGTPVSTGIFSVNNIGELSVSSFTADAGKLESASEFVISIEPSPDPDVAPSNTKIMGGSFIGQTADLSSENSLAIGTGFSTAVGKYILATPTNGDNSNELSGIWWLAPNGPSKSLVLPVLNEGWLYEGWVVFDGTPVSTGKFNNVDMADQFDDYSATLDAPSFPGEDFLTNAPAGITFPTDLSGKTAVISVEPDPDNSNKPFNIKPLTGNIPAMATDHILYDMINNASSISITGEVSR